MLIRVTFPAPTRMGRMVEPVPLHQHEVEGGGPGQQDQTDHGLDSGQEAQIVGQQPDLAEAQGCVGLGREIEIIQEVPPGFVGKAGIRLFAEDVVDPGKQPDLDGMGDETGADAEHDMLALRDARQARQQKVGGQAQEFIVDQNAAHDQHAADRHHREELHAPFLSPPKAARSGRQNAKSHRPAAITRSQASAMINIRLRRALTYIMLPLALAACSSVPPAALPPAAPETVAQHQIVVAAHPLAVEAGREILREGGSAVDAAIAVQMVLTLVEPQSSGIGGGGFMLHYDAGTQRIESYDGRETAPASAKPDMFLDAEGKPLPFYDAVVGG